MYCLASILTHSTVGGFHMDERITIISHKGMQIVNVDFSNLAGDQVVALIQRLPEAMQNMTPLRILVDGTNSRGSVESMAAFKDLFAELREAERSPGSVKAAGIGVGGLGKILFDGLVRLSPIPIRAFASKAEALNRLVEEPGP